MCRLVQMGYFLVNVAIIACSLSFSAPFWLKYSDSAGSVIHNAGSSFVNFFSKDATFGATQYEGLLAYCNKDIKCRGFWQNDFEWEKSLSDWQKACQGLFAAGLLLLLIGFFISTFHICCCCCKESFSIGSALGSLTLSGFVLISAALVVYGAYAHKEKNAGISSKDDAMYHWAYWVGVGGGVAGLVACILFFCEGCRNRSHSGYHMTRVV